MKKLYLFLVFLFLALHIPVNAKTVSFKTDNINAVVVLIAKEYSNNPVQWNDDGTCEAQLGDKDGINLQVNNGFLGGSVTVNGEVVTESFPSSYYLAPKNLPDGCVVDIKTKKKESTSVTIAGNPSQIRVKYNFRDYSSDEWDNGELFIPIVNTNQNVEISALTGCGIKSVMRNGEDVTGNDMKKFVIPTIGLSTGDNRYEVESFSIAEDRSSEFAVNVIGDKELVSISLAGDRGVLLSGNELDGPIKFNPDFDLPIQVQHAKYIGSDFYKVEVGEEQIPSVSGVYSIYSLKNGDVINVNVDFPKKQIPIRLNFVNPETEGAIRHITGDMNVIIPRTEWMADNWTVQMGTRINIEFNVDDYDIVSKLNGVEIDKSYVSFNVIDEAGYDIDIIAEPLDPFVVTVYYESLPAHFKVRIGASGDEYAEMTGKDSTKIYVPRNKNRILIVPDEDWVINEVVVDGETAGADVAVDGDMEVDVYMEEFVRDLESVFYIDPVTDWTSTSIMLSPKSMYREKTVTLDAGYNIVKYNELDLPLAVEVTINGGYDYPVFINGIELANPALTISELVEGSVVKFYGETPEYFKVNFNIEEGAPVEIYQDVIDKLDDIESVEVMRGTGFDILPEEGSEIEVSVNDIKQTAVEGKYTVYADSDLSITIKKGNPSGVSGIEDSDLTDVYSLQGIRVLRQASGDQIAKLPSGIYIMKGKKIVLQ